MNDWVGFLGGNRPIDIKTPNMDRLAQSSLVFTNAHTPAPACAPARTSIMTGVHPAVLGPEKVFWGDGPRWRDFEALKNVETLEQFFKNRGYTTLGAGKIYHSQAPPWSPTSQVEPESWDFYFPSPYISHPYQIRPPEDVIYPEGVDNEHRPGGMPGYWTWGPIDAPDNKMADYHVMDWASFELKRRHEKPFFLAAGTWKPHDPWEVPRRYFDMYPLEDIVLPEVKEDDLEDASDHGRRAIHRWVLKNDQWKKIVQAYAASMTFADAMVGRLLDTLERSEYAGNTIVVVWSDHGMHMGEKENFEKFTLWERSTHVPFMIRVPGVTRPGTRIDQPVSLMDMYPTLAELAGYEIPPHVDGTSLVPLMQNPAAKHDPVITSYRIAANPAWHLGPVFEPQTGHAVRSMNYRYIYYPGTGLEELYDHQTDPNEWDNVAYKEKYADVVEQHRQYVLKMIPDLTWKKGGPEGYSVSADGAVRNTKFMRMSDVR
jgi:arylsulfatase A-like enzyme